MGAQDAAQDALAEQASRTVELGPLAAFVVRGARMLRQEDGGAGPARAGRLPHELARVALLKER